MKRLMIWLMIIGIAALCACSSDNAGDAGDGELVLRQRQSGAIAREGEVDWYHFRAAETNTVLQVRCTSETLRPDVDLLVSVYELDAAGNKVLVYADHAPEDAAQPADLTLNMYIDRPKDIYVAVRDLMDDDASDNPYYITVDYAEMPEGNENFTQATPVTPDGGDCPVDRIGHVGDVDCFSFEVGAGVYDIQVLFSPFPDTRVTLSADLYNDSGELLATRSQANVNTYHLMQYLDAGRYFLEIDDAGRDDFDNASTYQVCVDSVDGVEGNDNDIRATAVATAFSRYGENITVTGALDYATDQDWHRLQLPAPAGDFRVLDIRFSGTAEIAYQIDLMDESGTLLLSHAHRGGADTYQTQIKLNDNGDTWLAVSAADGREIAASAPYSITLSAAAVDDPAEVDPADNDTVNTADPLVAGVETRGKIGYRGDVDWYSLDVPAHDRAQILEVYVDAPVSQVAYTLSVMGTGLAKKLYNTDSATRPTKLYTSLLVPANDAFAVYTFRVADFQDDSGDDVEYAIRAELKDIPSVLPPVAAGAPPYGAGLVYHDETSETEAHTVTLQYNSVTQKQFCVNTEALDISQAAVGTGSPATFTFPWIAGYVDYQGDQDWFLLDVQPPQGAADSGWHYRIFVDFYAPATHVEYVWRFYPDRNDNQVLANRSSDYDGFIASAGDGTLSWETLSLSTPAAGEDPFWVSSAWSGPAYFSISDFNYLLRPADGAENMEPDEDWGGYDVAPYYFRVRLEFHPEASAP